MNMILTFWFDPPTAGVSEPVGRRPSATCDGRNQTIFADPLGLRDRDASSRLRLDRTGVVQRVLFSDEALR